MLFIKKPNCLSRYTRKPEALKEAKKKALSVQFAPLEDIQTIGNQTLFIIPRASKFSIFETKLNSFLIPVYREDDWRSLNLSTIFGSYVGKTVDQIVRSAEPLQK